MKQNEQDVATIGKILIVIGLLVISIIIASTSLSANPSDEELSVIGSWWTKIIRWSSLERYLFYNITSYKNGTVLIIEADVNTTVYNFLRNTYLNWDDLTPQERMQRCLILEPYIQEDYPNFDCDIPEHRQELLIRLTNYIENGWQLFQNGVDRGFINVTGSHIIVTIPNIQHLDRIRIGQYTFIEEYQDINVINYHSDWFDVNVTLFVNDSDGWNSTANDVWVLNRENDDKFGANVSRTENTYFKYLIEASREIKREGLIYYISRSWDDMCGQLHCIMEERHEFDFQDICRIKTNETNITFNPECNFNLDGNTLEVTFYGEYNETLGNIVVDPTVTITNVGTYASVKKNVTTEGKIGHLSISNISSPINDTNLVLYMPMDTNVSTIYIRDYSKNDNDGTIVYDAGPPVDGAYYTENGIIGGAFEFDGDGDYIDVSTLDSYANGKGYITISAWVKFNASQHNKEVVGWWWNDNCDIRIDQNKIAWFVDADTDTGVNSGSANNDGKWYHVVGTYDKDAGADNVILYIDGISVGTATTTGNVDSTDKFNIGNINGAVGSAYVFNGTIDEVLIFNRSLSAEEISALYKNQSSRFFGTGSQAFQDINVSSSGSEDTVNVSVHINEFFSSMINVTIGDVSGTGYSYGSEYAFTNGNATSIPITTPNNISVKILYYAGNDSNYYPFLTPNLMEDIVLYSWESAPPADTCTYTSGNWAVDCDDNCSITSNVTLDANANITFSNAGNFIIKANITNWNLINISSGCLINITSGSSL
jgi:hypothetical protein